MSVTFLTCVTEKRYEVEHVTVKTDQWLGRTEDRRSWTDKYAGKLACLDRGQMSAINAPYKELGQVVMETGDLVTGTLQDSIPEDVSILCPAIQYIMIQVYIASKIACGSERLLGSEPCYVVYYRRQRTVRSLTLSGI